MPDIDLDPHEFGERDPTTGRLRKPMSAKWHRNWFFVSLVPLAVIFWHRDELDNGTLFAATAMFALLAGLGLFGWVKDIY
jgi:hypothetical protein